MIQPQTVPERVNRWRLHDKNRDLLQNVNGVLRTFGTKGGLAEQLHLANGREDSKDPKSKRLPEEFSVSRHLTYKPDLSLNGVKF